MQIVSGLSPGDKVVVRGALLLDGSADQLLCRRVTHPHAATLIELCVRRASARAGRHRGHRGLRRQRVSLPAGRGLSRRHQRAGGRDRAAAGPGAGGNRAAGHGADRARAQRHARHDPDAQREPVRAVARHAHLRRRRGLVQVAGDRERAPRRGRPAAGHQREAGARGHAARRDLPVPRRERPPHVHGNAVRAGVDGLADAPAGAGRRRRGDLRRLPEGGARRGRSVASARARPLAGRRQRRAEPVEPERRRRLSAARRSAAGDSRRRLHPQPAGRAGDRAQERGRHAGHGRRRLARRAVAHAAARRRRLQPRTARSPRASRSCAAARTRASCSTASTTRSGS